MSTFSYVSTYHVSYHGNYCIHVMMQKFLKNYFKTNVNEAWKGTITQSISLYHRLKRITVTIMLEYLLCCVGLHSNYCNTYRFNKSAAPKFMPPFSCSTRQWWTECILSYFTFLLFSWVVTKFQAANRAVFTWGSKSNWFFITSLHDWLKNLRSLFSSNRK